MSGGKFGNDKFQDPDTIKKFKQATSKSAPAPGLNARQLAEELHNAGLNGLRDYKSMGKSADHWREFRLEIAIELLKRIKAETRQGI